MRDPIDELENFDPGLTMNPLPAAEVRRRGARLRRRNTALATVGGVAAVAIIAAPLAILGGHDRSATPQPAPAPPTASWVQQIPEDFPLDDGLPTPARTSATYDSPVTEVCRGAGWDPTGSVDLRQATYTAPEGGSTHTLALYPTERQAELVLLSLRADAQACALQTDGQDRAVEVLAIGDDERSLAYVHHYSDGGDLDAVQFVRVGNALLQATRYSAGVPAQDTADLVSQEAAPVIAQMCLFAADGCTDTAIDSAPAAARTIPADFPLLDGLPTRAATDDFGRYGPGQDEDLLTIPGCGDDTLPTPQPDDWLRGGWRDPAEARDRELVVFSSTAEATAYVAAFTDLATCEEEDLGGGVTRIHSGAGSDLGLGDQAEIAIIWNRVDGKPAPGFRITEMVRVGNAVIVQDRIADGPDDNVTSAYLEQIIGESDQSLAGVAAAMCAYSDGGC